MEKRFFFIVFCSLLALNAFSKAPQTQGETRLRIGTYNLRMQNMDKGDNAWPLRRARVVESINDNAFDIFGVQELTVDAEKDLAWLRAQSYNNGSDDALTVDLYGTHRDEDAVWPGCYQK